MTNVVVGEGGKQAATRTTGATVPLRHGATAALAVTALAALTLLVAVDRMPPDITAEVNSTVSLVLTAVGMVGLAIAGTVLAQQQPRSTIAWLMIATALAWTASGLVLVAAVLRAGAPGAATLGWLTNWSWIPAQALSMIMLLRFPTGRLPGRRWRPAEWAVISWAAVTGLVTAFLPGPLGAEPLAPMTNPLGWTTLESVGDLLLGVLFGLLPAMVVTACAAPVVRWRCAGTRERDALAWVALAAATLAVSAPIALLARAGEVLQGLAMLLIPIAIGVAVLREELWDLDLQRRYDRLRVVREQERERLRHELHDSLGPLLGSISMRAEAARNQLGAGATGRADELLASVGAATEGAMDGVRRLIDDLGPQALAGQGLVRALEEELAVYGDAFAVELRTSPDPLPALEEHAAGTAYLVVVEAVRNAARHSGGSGAVVDLRTVGDRLTGAVTDDGKGVGSAPAGIGRTAMARRVTEIGGRLSVTDGPAGGCVVCFEIGGAVR